LAATELVVVGQLLHRHIVSNTLVGSNFLRNFSVSWKEAATNAAPCQSQKMWRQQIKQQNIVFTLQLHRSKRNFYHCKRGFHDRSVRFSADHSCSQLFTHHSPSSNRRMKLKYLRNTRKGPASTKVKRNRDRTLYGESDIFEKNCYRCQPKVLMIIEAKPDTDPNNTALLTGYQVFTDKACGVVA